MTPAALVVHVDPDADGAWRVRVGGVDERKHGGRLSPDEVLRVLAAVEAGLAAGSGDLLVPGEEVAVVAGEEAAGRALGEILRCSPEVAARVGVAVGAASAAGVPLYLLLELHDPALWALPWELLSLHGAPAEPENRAVIARLGPAGRAPAPRSALRPLVWALDDDDPEVTRLLAALERGCAAAGLPAPARVGRDPVRLDEPALLVLIGHGEADGELLSLLDPEGAIGGGTVTHALAAVLPTVVLAVLLICDGGFHPVNHADALVQRMLRIGARAVVATPDRLPVDSAERFLDGLLPTLAAERAVACAVRAGRAAVAAAADPAPEARWWRLALTVSAAAALDWRAERGLPADWRPGPGARAALQRALVHARQRRSPWLGVEHLALALLDDSAEVPDEWAPALYAKRDLLDHFISRFDLATTRPPAPTPRLRAVIDALPPGFGVPELLVGLVDTIPPLVRLALGPGGGDDAVLPVTLTDLQTRELLHAQAPGDGAWEEIEVLGGPEDGRRLRLAVGEVLGRGYPRRVADALLYADGSAFDLALSSRHAQRLDDRRLELLHTSYRVLGRDTGTLLARGSVIEVGADDVVGATKATWLWFVPAGRGRPPGHPA